MTRLTIVRHSFVCRTAQLELSPWTRLDYAPLAALFPVGAALEPNHAGSVSPNAGTVAPPVTQ